MITVIDYGIGNTGSIVNMVGHIGGDAVVSSDPNEVAQASAIVLPGVGSFDRAMSALQTRDLVQPLQQAASGGASMLGVCLGMQLLFDSSEEGELPGLGLVPGAVRAFSFSGRPKERRPRVPHMGWNVVNPDIENELFAGEIDEWRFYFVHGYYASCEDREDIAGVTHHGHDFVSAVNRGNVFGTQFHPEKSHRFGKQLFKNFWDLACLQ